ncbi:transmembrane protein, putative [Bodo saltans]|uniref:Transmembrane protein, putative n=1 Tax=Bodo saltans TaxID=75058 RepID=A0A0S4KPE3_BODSA|nr:transmembrane protein, putative [Bodo saltans]|eukprot:CUI14786.1 transmembrane protein, putative [Bodo saltans]
MEAKHQSNVDQARELLKLIKTVGVRQTYWKELLEEVYEKEAVEEEQTRALSKEVLLQEAESLANGEFVTWLSARQKQQSEKSSSSSQLPDSSNSTVGLEGLVNWFHSDVLALETPFAAMVPFPRRLSDDGLTFFKESVDELLFDSTTDGDSGVVSTSTSSSSSNVAYVCTVLANQPHNELSALLNSNARSSGSSSKSAPSSTSTGSYSTIPCRSGAEVVSLCVSNAKLKAALDQHPCVFLSTKPLHFQFVAKIAVVGGIPIAVQVDHLANNATVSSEGQRELASFVLQDVIGPALAGRTCYLLVGGTPSPQRNGGIRWSLLGVDTLAGQELECFTEREILMAARVLVPLHRKLKKLAACSAAPGEPTPAVAWTAVWRTYLGGTAPDSGETPQESEEAAQLRLAEEIKDVIDACRNASANVVPHRNSNAQQKQAATANNEAVEAALRETATTVESTLQQQQEALTAATKTASNAPSLVVSQGTPPHREGHHSNAMLAAAMVSSVAATLGIVLVAGKFLRSSK